MHREYVVLTIARMYQIKQRVANLEIRDSSLDVLRNEICAIADEIHTLPRNMHDNGIFAGDAEIIAEMLLYLEEHCLCSHNNIIRAVIEKLAECWGINLDSNVFLFVHGKFAVKHYRFIDKLNQDILLKRYGVHLTKLPRIVYIPAFYDNDLLFTSILYHEVGHMVEHDYGIGELLYAKIEELIRIKPKCKVLNNYFKGFFEGNQHVDGKILRSHINEYVADIFACQYLGKNTLHYVAYIEADARNADRHDHPTFANREKLVNKFVDYMESPTNYTDDEFIKAMIEVYENTNEIAGLGKKYVAIDISPMFQNNSITITNDEQLYSLFYHIWNVTLDGIHNNEYKCNIRGNTLSVNDYYCWLNQTIAQSISGYLKDTR